MEISRFNIKATENTRVEAKERLWEKANTVQRVAAEADTKIRTRAEANKRKIESEEAESRSKAEANIKEMRIKRGRQGKHGRRLRKNL